MRHKLKRIENERSTFLATFERFGSGGDAYSGTYMTVLFKNVSSLSGKPLTDHLWFRYTKGFQTLDLKEGDLIRFDARPKAYQKNYRGSRNTTDYKLSYPTKIAKMPFSEWASLIAESASVAPPQPARIASAIFHPLELSVLAGAGVEPTNFLAFFREQHPQNIVGAKRSWSNYYEYMTHNSETLAEIIKAYRLDDRMRYILLHAESWRVDALLALRQLKGFDGNTYREVLQKLLDDKCELDRTYAWRLLRAKQIST